MKIDRYIELLVKLRQEHGPDLQVVTSGVRCGPFRKAESPCARYAHKEHPKLYFLPGQDPDRLRGEKVVRV